MSYKEDIFTYTIEQLRNIKDKTNLVVADLCDIDWINTLDAHKINEIFIKFICICDDQDLIDKFMKNLEETTVKPEPPTDEQVMILFKYANSFWMKLMVSKYKYLTTGPTPRDPESKDEEILYCLCTSLSEKMPLEIIIHLLTIVNLDVVTPDYHQDALSIICETGNIDYIRVILQRAVNEKCRADLLEYIQDRRWISIREFTVEFIEKMEHMFHTCLLYTSPSPRDRS